MNVLKWSHELKMSNQNALFETRITRQTSHGQLTFPWTLGGRKHGTALVPCGLELCTENGKLSSGDLRIFFNYVIFAIDSKISMKDITASAVIKSLKLL